MRKATYANGVVLYYDEEKSSPGTHFGDADRVAHELVTDEAAADDETERFEDPNAPAPAAAASGDFVPAG